MADQRVGSVTTGGLAGRASTNPPPACDVPRPIPFQHLKAPALWLVVLLMLATAALWLLNLDAVWDPPYVNLVLQLALVSATSLPIAFLATRSFLYGGSWPVLWLGAGSLVYGLAVALGSAMLLWASVNAAVTTHNLVALVAAGLHLLGAFFVGNGIPRRPSGPGRLATALQVYLGSLAVVAVTAAAALLGLLPPFFVQGRGGTSWRDLVVAADMLLFLLAGLALLGQYRRSRADFLYWYALGLLLVALLMAGALLTVATGSPLSWLVRGAQLLSGLYLLVAALVLVGQARAGNVRPSEMLAGFFWHGEASLRLLFESIMDAIVVTDQSFVITDWNRAAEAAYGWKAEEVVGRPVSEVLRTAFTSETDRGQALEALLAAGTWRGEVLHTHRDGRRIPVLATVSALRDAAGRVVGAVGVNRDIAGRKAVEEQLRRSEELTRDLIRYAPTGIYEVDFRTGRFRSINDAMCDILGYTRPELMAMTAFDLLDDAGRAHFRDRIRRTLAGETVDPSVEYRVIKKDGTAIYGVLNVRITYSDGRPDGAFVIAHDVTERRRAAEELRLAADTLERRVQARTADLQEANQRLAYQAHLLENINDMLTVSDTQRSLILWNPVAEELTGWQAGEVLGRTALEVLEGEWVGIEREEVDRHLAETGRFRGEMTVRRKDGSRMCTDVTSVAVKDEEGKIAAYVAVYRDITERRRAEEELRAGREQMQALSHRLIAAAENERRAVARELHDNSSQLIVSLMLGLALLEKQYAESEDACRHIAYLHQIADDLSRSMHDLAVSLRPASLDRVGLAPALEQFTRMLESQAHIPITLITTGLEERLGPDAETAVYRIVQESLTNVVRHAHATSAGVAVQRHEDRVLVSVEDDGQGFDLDAAWRTGRLGLTGMRERADMLGGTFAVETSPGAGTTIYVDLPCPARAAAPDQGAA